MFNVIIKNGKGETLQTVECTVDICPIGKARTNLIQLRGWRPSTPRSIAPPKACSSSASRRRRRWR